MFVTNHDIKKGHEFFFFLNLQPLLCVFQYQYVVAMYHILFSAYTKYSGGFLYLGYKHRGCKHGGHQCRL